MPLVWWSRVRQARKRNKKSAGVYGGNVEGKEPELKHSMFSKLRDVGLRLEVPESQKPRSQKRQETRDKNTGRKVVSVPTRENNQEVTDIMSQSSTHEAFENKNQSAEATVARIGESLQTDTAIMAHEMRAFRMSFEKQQSWQAQVPKVAIFVGAVAGGVILGSLATNAILNRGEPELPAGHTKK
jgi:hypothetical protein